MENNILPLEYSEINEEIRQRAIKELNETVENRILCLKELKETIKCKYSRVPIILTLKKAFVNTDK